MRPLLAVLFALLCAVSVGAQSGGGPSMLEATLTATRFAPRQYAYFGTTLAMDGDHAAASGEQQNRPGSGVVHALRWSGSHWEVHQEIAPPGGVAAFFGADIDIEGDLMFVGAPGREFDPTSPTGSVYVYALTGDEWVLSGVIAPPGPRTQDLFGASLDFDGERLIVGATNLLTARGAGVAYVYERAGASWALTASLASPFERSYSFGMSVAIDGPHAAVTDVDERYNRANTYRLGAGGQWMWESNLATDADPFWDNYSPMVIEGERLVAGSPRAGSGEGAVAVYDYDSGGWTRTATLLDVGGFQARLGSSIDVDGDQIVAGAPRLDNSRALVFSFNGATWSRTAILASPPPQHPSSVPFTDMGVSIALDGDRVLVGAPWTAVDELARAGAVVQFVVREGAWTRALSVPVGYPQSRARFGADVALAGGRVAVGAPRDGPWGSVHIYSLGAEGPALEARLSENQSLYGSAVAIGLDQVMVGAPWAEGSNFVYVYSLGEAGWTLTQTLLGDGAFGAAISIDGNRALVGAPGTSSVWPGRAYVYERSGGTWGLVATLFPVVPEAAPEQGQTFGVAVALDGARALVGAPSARVDTLTFGAAYVYESDGDGWERVATLSSGTPDETFGWGVALNGGRALVGSVPDPGVGPGGAYLFEGTGWTRTGSLPGPGPGGTFGDDVALDGGRALVSGALDGIGRAYLYGYDGAVWSRTAALTSPRQLDFEEFGASVAVKGQRFAVGAPYLSLTPPVSGAVYVYRDQTADADEAAPVVGGPRLQAPRPNPATGTARLVLSLSQPERVVATVYDALGRSVQTLLDGVSVNGNVTLTVGADRLAPGLYVVRVVGETFAESARLVVAR